MSGGVGGGGRNPPADPIGPFRGRLPALANPHPAPEERHDYSDRAPEDSFKLHRSGMDCARRHHAAPMGLKTVLFGLVYYKHVAPMELAVAAQRREDRGTLNA